MVQLRPKVSIEEMFTKKRSVLKKKKTLGSECQREHVALRTSGKPGTRALQTLRPPLALPRERSGCADSLARRRRAQKESVPEARTRARLPGLRRTGLSGTGKAGSGTTHVLPPRGPYSIGIFKMVRQ